MAKTDTLEAIAMLKDDHVQLKTLLEKLKKAGEGAPQKRSQLLEEIRTAFEAHMVLEEEIFYPAFRKALGTKAAEKMYFEALEEHRAAKMVLQDALGADPKSPSFGGKAKVLAELIVHHADEEEDEMFPKARKALSLEQRRALGQQMAAFKRDLALAA